MTITLPFGLGEARSYGGLTLYPLFPLEPPRLEFVGLDEALARGARLREVDGAGALAFENPLEERVLLYEGEELAGAMVQRTALVEARSTALLPVHSAKQGRGAYRTPVLSTAPRAATLEEYAGALPRLDGQCGVVAGIGGVLACLDYVGRADVFAGLYAKLVRGYALDAAERPLRRAAVEWFLRRLAGEPRRLSAAVALGSESRFGGQALGIELSAHGELVALSALPA